jgi:hypothetical protein
LWFGAIGLLPVHIVKVIRIDYITKSFFNFFLKFPKKPQNKGENPQKRAKKGKSTHPTTSHTLEIPILPMHDRYFAPSNPKTIPTPHSTPKRRKNGSPATKSA